MVDDVVLELDTVCSEALVVDGIEAVVVGMAIVDAAVELVTELDDVD